MPPLLKRPHNFGLTLPCATRMLASRTIRQEEVTPLDRSHCLRTCFWYSSGSTRFLARMPAAAFQLLGIRGRGCQTPCCLRVSTGVLFPIASSFPQTARRGTRTAASPQMIDGYGSITSIQTSISTTRGGDPPRLFTNTSGPVGHNVCCRLSGQQGRAGGYYRMTRGSEGCD